MKSLFEKTTLGCLNVRSRFVRSATHAGFADGQGLVTEELIQFAHEQARHDIGIFITGHAYVMKEGQASPGQLSVCEDKTILGLSNLRKTITSAGACAFLQIAHAGCAAREKISGTQPFGPSERKEKGKIIAREATKEDIARVINAFYKGAKRAYEAGFDGVQIHAAHGYLISQFLSPFYNKRKDRYGGSLKNRMKLLIDIVDIIKQRMPGRFSLSVKLNSEDFLDSGLNKNEMLKIVCILQKHNVDCIELSGGTIDSGERSPIRKGDPSSKAEEVYYKDAFKEFKKVCSLPLIGVGGIRSLSVAEGLISENLLDYVALSRPLIREPGLVSDWGSGKLGRAKCISCNLCFRPLMSGKGLYCVLERKESGSK